MNAMPTVTTPEDRFCGRPARLLSQALASVREDGRVLDLRWSVQQQRRMLIMWAEGRYVTMTGHLDDALDMALGLPCAHPDAQSVIDLVAGLGTGEIVDVNGDPGHPPSPTRVLTATLATWEEQVAVLVPEKTVVDIGRIRSVDENGEPGSLRALKYNTSSASARCDQIGVEPGPAGPVRAIADAACRRQSGSPAAFTRHAEAPGSHPEYDDRRISPADQETLSELEAVTVRRLGRSKLHHPGLEPVPSRMTSTVNFVELYRPANPFQTA
jgi:hypothetical protein